MAWIFWHVVDSSTQVAAIRHLCRCPCSMADRAPPTGKVAEFSSKWRVQFSHLSAGTAQPSPADNDPRISQQSLGCLPMRVALDEKTSAPWASVERPSRTPKRIALDRWFPLSTRHYDFSLKAWLKACRVGTGM